MESDSDEFLYFVDDISTDAKGNVYVADRRGYSVVKFTSDGEFVNRVGGRGEGPGEFRQGPGVVAACQDTIWVVDDVANRVHVMSTGLRSIADFVPRVRVTDLDCGSGGNLFATYFTRGDDEGKESGGLFLGHVVSDSIGNWDTIPIVQLNGIDPNRERGAGLWNMAKLAVSGDGSIWVAYTFRNRVVGYTAEGELISEFSIAGTPDEAESNDSGPYEVPVGLLLADTAVPDSSQIFVLRVSQESGMADQLVAVNSRGELKEEVINLSTPTGALAADGNGHLYVTNNAEESIRIVKYQIPRLENE